MDRPTTRTDADARGSRPSPHEAFVLPSRRPALDLCRGLLIEPAGPILLTGDPGAGKTWLWRHLEASDPGRARWSAVELPPADGPADLYRLVAHELALAEADASRLGLGDFLVDRKANGERHALVIEEAQDLSPVVWEEVRVLANRLGRPGGFASMILVGQTSLARRFSTRPFASMEARLAARVHLGPIDADEAMALLRHLRPGRAWSVEEAELLHRDALGNPGRMLRAVGPVAAKPGNLARETAKPPVLGPPSPAPLTGPDRPPIRVEDNMIEVGWSPEEAATAPDEAEPIADHADDLARPSGEAEETVKDHYAALQAWREWAANQGHPAARTPATTAQDLADEDEIDLEAIQEDDDPAPIRPSDRPHVWADGEQKFAPFGQLFSRMAQAREPE